MLFRSMKQLIRYIHNNPVKAGMVSKVQEYKWSSMKEYFGTEIQLVDKDTKEEIMNDYITRALVYQKR